MKHLLIIGANSDIAKSTARYYASHGYSLSLTARQTDQLSDFAQDLKVRHNCAVTLYELDLLDSDQRDNFLNSIDELPTVVLFAAGYLGNQEVAQTDASEVNKIFNVNALSAISVLDYFANKFEQRKAGCIIAISSVAGDRGRKSNYYYGAAKSAISTYLSGLRNRLHASNIPVIDIKPGFVATKMTAHLDLPDKLTVTPEYVAKSIFNAQVKKKNTIYVSPIWRVIMLIITMIPEFIFKRLSL